MKYKVVIEIEGTGRSISFVRDGIENTLDVARQFMWRNMDADEHLMQPTGGTSRQNDTSKRKAKTVRRLGAK